MKPLSFDNEKFMAYCLKQKTFDIEAIQTYLKKEGVADSSLADYLLKAETVIKERRKIKRNIYEGIFITSVGLLGISYAYSKKVDGTVWVLWSALGLGVLTLGLVKKRKSRKL